MPDARHNDGAFAMPEFARALRGLASAQGLGRTEHMAVFGPLLLARKEAELAGTPGARVASFDPTRLRRAWLESIESMAAARVPKGGADRRALTARLMECADPALAALPGLERAAARVRDAGGTIEPGVWRAWIEAVQLLFDAADRFWLSIEPHLGPAPAPRRKGPGNAGGGPVGAPRNAS
jgi:hypothetical protein